MANRTRGARGGSNLNRTLNESPRHRLASLGNPKKKNVPCFSDFRGGGFFLKRKGHFSFWGSARKDIRAVWRGEMRKCAGKNGGVQEEEIFARSFQNLSKKKVLLGFAPKYSGVTGRLTN